MSLRLNRIAYPVTALGPGKRLVLWVQGCSIRCAGCASKDMWDIDGGSVVDPEDLAQELAPLCVQQHLSGLSISGGEPTEQAAELARFVDSLRRYLADIDMFVASDFDVLVFSGHSVKTVRKRPFALWEVCDAMVCGPYREDRPRGDALRASDNQVLACRTRRHKDSYRKFAQNASCLLQVSVDASGLSLVGIPDVGELSLIEEKLSEKGIELKGCSWRK